MVIEKTQRCYGINWRRTTSERRCWLFAHCNTQCLLGWWGILRRYRNTHWRSSDMWTTSTSVKRIWTVWFQLVSTATAWCRIYLRMMIRGTSPSWYKTRSTPKPIQQKWLSSRREPTEHDYRCKMTWSWQQWSQSCGWRVRGGVQSQLSSPRSLIMAIVIARGVVWRVRCIAADLLCNTPDAIF